MKNTVIKTSCLRIFCQGTPKRAVHAEGGAVSINTKVKSEDTEITDSRNRRHSLPVLPLVYRHLNLNIYTATSHSNVFDTLEQTVDGTVSPSKNVVTPYPKRQIISLSPRSPLCIPPPVVVLVPLLRLENAA